MSLLLKVREPTPEDFIRSCQRDSSGDDSPDPIEEANLPKDAVARLLSRAEFDDDASKDQKEYFKREKSLKAPRTGEIVPVSFPPDAQIEKPDALRKEEEEMRKELKVIRYMPEGKDLETVPQITITFNQPMVPISSIDELKKLPVPVRVEPEGVLEAIGEWRWLGTKCLKFHCNENFRLPKSTVFKVTVPKGVRSELGCELPEALSFEFSTKTLQIKNKYPSTSGSGYGKAGPLPVMYLEFNQKIDAEHIASQLQISGNEIVRLTKDEVLKRIDAGGIMKKKRPSHYATYQRYLKSGIPDTFVWFSFARPVALDSTHTITVPAGTKSAEGPRPSSRLAYSFRTYGPMRISDRYPKPSDDILPLQAWTVYFSNNIELESFDDTKHIRISPAIEGLGLQVSTDRVVIRGRTKGRTRYSVTFDKDLPDIYGQTLEKDSEVVFDVGPARQTLTGFHNGQVIVHDVTMKGDDPTFSIVSTNLAKAHVVIYRVHPTEFHRSCFGSDYYRHTQQWSGVSDRSPQQEVNCGKVVFDGDVELNGEPDELGETLLHLRPHLQHPEDVLGQLVVYVEPHQGSWKTQRGREWRHRPRIKTWVQVTKTAVDAFASCGGSMYAFSTDLATGAIVPNTSFTIQAPLHSYTGDYKKTQISTVAGDDGIGFLSGYSSKSQQIVWVDHGKDISFVQRLNHISRMHPRTLYYVVNDRNLYKPKETITIKGLIRFLHYEDWKKLLVIPATQKLRWDAYDARQAKFKSGELQLNENGGFDLKFDIPDNVNLGTCRINFRGGGCNTQHTFKVQEFRTPEFTAVTKVPSGPYLVNGIAIVTGIAEYFSGGGMAGCESRWEVTQSNTTYRPPGFTFNGFNFGCSWRPIKPPPPPKGAPAPSPSPSIPLISSSLMPRGIPMPPPPPPSFGLPPPPPSSSSLSPPRRKPGSLELKGSTNAQGEHKLCVEFNDDDETEIKTPVTVTTSLNIQDINRQTMGSSSSFIVHPSKLYVGLKLKKTYCKAGDPLPVDVVVTNIDGDLIEGTDVLIRVILRYSERVGYRTVQKEEVLDTIKFASGSEAKELTLKMPDGGNFYIVASIKDERGLPNFASAQIWVSGGTRGPKAGSRVIRQQVDMIANKKTYQPGDVANILVTAPFDPPAEGVLFVCCNGFAERQSFTMKERSTVVRVPIKEEYIPNCMVRVSIAGSAERLDEQTGRPSAEAPKRPAFAAGQISLRVPPEKMTIGCEVTPDKKIMKPGEDGKVTVQLSSTDGSFKSGESLVSLIIVDEAVLSLTGYELPHPIKSFYTNNSSSYQEIHLRSSVVMKNWSSIKVEKPLPPPMPPPPPRCFSCCRCACACAPGCALGGCCPPPPCPMPCSAPCPPPPPAGAAPVSNSAAAPEEPGPAIEVRTNFNPLACFISDAKVDEAGKAEIPFTLPDNLTRYRVWVLATSGSKYYGLGESSIQAQLPVAIRPSLPRFLNFGDVAEFCVVLQNQTLAAITVDVAVRMTNLSLVDPVAQGRKVVIPYTKRAELRFPVQTEKCGKARFQIVAAVSGTDFADAVEKSLPVYTPSTTEAFATYGELDDDGAVIQSILPPPDIYNQFGGLEITTSSTALQALTDAFLYLFHYEFDCVEQASSRMLSICALQNILDAFSVPSMPSKAELQKVIATGVQKIKRCQRSDGAIGFWTIHSSPSIYISIYATHALLRATLQGYDVDATILNRGKTFCQNVDTYIRRYCGWYGPYSQASLKSFALYVLALFAINDKLTPHEKDQVVKQATAVWGSFEKYLSHEGKAWLALALWACSKEKANHAIVKVIMKWFMNNVNETPETANFITSYGDDGKLVMLHSNRRTDGVMLEVLIHLEEKNYLIPKIVKGLLAHRKKGRWGSTQENCYILLSLKKYFEVYEKLVPDFVARVWLGEDYCGQVEFHGRETDYKQISVPMKVIVPDPASPPEKKELVIWKKGPGRLYYRLGMDYAPRKLDLKPLDYGFSVDRVYEAVTDPSHVMKDPESGVWTFKAGELIRVKLRLTNVSRRYHVALVDFIPAGCEVLNPDLKGGQKVPAGLAPERGSMSSSAYSPYRWCWWMCYRKWYEHVNRRDERVEAFASYLYCGVHEYEYIMSATSIGQFVVPPAKAEEMYSPELFGRSASEKVIVKQ